VRGKGRPAERLAVQGSNRGIRLFLRSHLHETEAARAAGLPVGDHLDFHHRTTVLFEEGTQLVLIAREGQIPDIEPGTHQILLEPGAWGRPPPLLLSRPRTSPPATFGAKQKTPHGPPRGDPQSLSPDELGGSRRRGNATSRPRGCQGPAFPSRNIFPRDLFFLNS